MISILISNYEDLPANGNKETPLTTVSIWQIAAFIGMTNAVKAGHTMAPLYHRQLQALINRVLYTSSWLNRGNETELPPLSGTLSGSQNLVVSGS